MKRIALWVVVAAVTVTAACTDSNKYSTSPTQLALTGVFAGPVSGLVAAAPYSTGLTYTLTQTGNAVTGTWSTALGNAGTVAGTVSGASVAFTLVQTAPCAGSVTGTATISNNGMTLAGSYAGTMCGQALSASFSVTRP